MRVIFSILFLATVASAYVPITRPVAAVRSPLFRPMASMAIQESSAINDIASDVSGKIGTVLEKTDDLLLSRAMRFVNHAPAIATLSAMIAKLGGSARFGLDIAPSALALSGPAGLGAVPSWVGYCLPLMVVTQAASIARSALSDSDELSQSDISAMAVSNFAFTRALTCTSPTNWAIAAVASGYYNRNGHGSESTSIKNLSMQVASSVSTAATVLAVTAQLPSIIPFLKGQTEVTAMLGLLGMLGLTTQDGNSTVKRCVNAAILGGLLVSKVAGGALQLSKANLLSKGIVVTLSTAYVAAVAVSRAQQAIMD